MVWRIFFQSNNRDTDIKNKCMDTKGEEGRWDELGLGIDIHTLWIVRIKQITAENSLYSGEPCSALCGDLAGKEIQKRGDMCVHMADSFCCTPETDTAV